MAMLFGLHKIRLLNLRLPTLPKPAIRQDLPASDKKSGYKGVANINKSYYKYLAMSCSEFVLKLE